MIRKIKELLGLFETSRVYREYYKSKLQKKMLLFSAGEGGRPSGNILKLLSVAAKRYGSERTIFFGVDKRYVSATENALAKHSIDGVNVIPYGSLSFQRYTEVAKTIITDSPLPESFVKRKGQSISFIRSNAADEKEGMNSLTGKMAMDTVQRNLFASDYIIFPDKKVRDSIVNAYCLDGLYGGKLLYCSFIREQSVVKLIDYILAGKEYDGVESIRDKKKERVYIYGGALDLNGITRSLHNLLGMIDDGRVYYPSYSRKNIERDNRRAENIPDGYPLIELSGQGVYTPSEAMSLFLYYKFNTTSPFITKRVKRFFKREFIRNFSGMDFDAYIHFDGYGSYYTGLLREADKRKIIFVHNDMKRELASRANAHEPTLRDAYRAADRTAIVAAGLSDVVYEISGRRDNIRTVNNVQDFKSIIERGKQPIVFDEGTLLYINSNEDLTPHSKMNSDKMNSEIMDFFEKHDKVFVTVGRFSDEKNHKGILEAFDKLETEERVGLIIIGGLGNLFEETVHFAAGLKKKGDVAIIKAISNPFPIMKKCDYFLLASKYEGMPMVFFEAQCMGLPSFATATKGSKEFMEEFGGTLEEPTEQGIIDGFTSCLEGKIDLLKVDLDEYNQRCIAQFEELLS